MLDVISTAKKTQWNAFPTLCSVYSYSHVSNEAVDFQVIPGKNCFVEFNKKFGFELLRTVNKDSKESIQRIKKRPVDDLSCGAISKGNGGQIALGLTTGFIRMFNVQTGDYVPIKFKPDRVGNSVVGLDYSNTDEYLAAVYDSADINLFGLKTGIRTDTFRFDGQSTLVRFHPVRKFVLAVGSYEGGITVMDIQTKKKLFYDKNAHEAPIPDISMYNSSQDIFVSCGYDCSIKVFDLRKRSVVQNHKQSHPMSTVCISPCGMFCVAGNLKGDVISYDFRNMTQPLDTKRVHDSAVVRVAFIPSVTSDSNLTLDYTVDTTHFDTTTPVPSSVSTPYQSKNRDSFAKFADLYHHNNVAAFDDLSTPKRRDSWEGLIENRKIQDFSMDSCAETPSRMSLGIDNNRSELRLKRLTRKSLDQSLLCNASSMGRELEVENKTTNTDHPKDGKVLHNKPSRDTRVSHLFELDRFNDLQKIQEENTETDGKSIQPEGRKPLGAHDNSDNVLRGRKRRSTFHESFSMHIKDTNTSSPTIMNAQRLSNTDIGMNHCSANAISSIDLREMLANTVDNKIDGIRHRMASRMEASTKIMKSRIDQQTEKTTGDIKNILEQYYLLGLQGGDNLMNRLEKPFDRLENGLCDLLERDQWAMEYFKMKFGIIELMKKLGIREPNILDHLK